MGDFSPIFRDPDPIEVAERDWARAARADGPCDRCGRPVLQEESAVEFEYRLAARLNRPLPLSVALGGHRHVLCSPSRAQYLPGHPRSLDYPYASDREEVAREVLAGMRRDAGLA